MEYQDKTKEQIMKEQVELRQRIAELEAEQTQRKPAEERIEHLNLVLRTIGNLNRLLAREKDRDRLLSAACDRLTETRGYYNAWIAMLDDSGGLVTSAESGLGEDFSAMVERLKRGELTHCGRRALIQSDVVVSRDPLSTCADCPLADKYSGRGAMTVRLEYSGKVYGLLSASIPRSLTAEEEELSRFQEVATDIAFALHNIEVEEERNRMEEELLKKTHELGERVKELNCLYRISNLAGNQDISLEEILQGTVDLIPPLGNTQK